MPLFCHTFPLHTPGQLQKLLTQVPLERMEKIEMRREIGCDPPWGVTLHHHALTGSEMHRILMKLDEGADLVQWLETFHTP